MPNPYFLDLPFKENLDFDMFYTKNKSVLKFVTFFPNQNYFIS